MVGNQGNHQKKIQSLISKKPLTDFHRNEVKKMKKGSEMADSKKLSFSKLPILKIFLRKFQTLVLGLVGLIDAKDIDVAQPI